MREVLTDTYRAAARLIDAADTVTVVGHVRSDADAIGSVSALLLALRQLGKTATGVIGQPVPFAENLLSIPGAGEIRVGSELPPADLVITVDCGSLDRTGFLAEAIANQWEKTLVIDHHSSNPGFGRVDLLVAEAESTTTVLRELFRELGVVIDRDIAHCIYAGLVTDTGNFRWGRPVMHELAAELMATGIDTQAIAVELIDSNSLPDLQMIGRVLSGVQMHRVGACQVATLVASHEVLAGHSDSAVEGLVDFVRALDGADVGVVFKEMLPGVWAVSLRSTWLDVSRFAVSLGGGGHVPAAGYTTHGTIEEALDELLGVMDRFGASDPA